MIPRGRTSTSVWQIHSLEDLNSFLQLSLPLHCSLTLCGLTDSGGSWTRAGTGKAWALLLRIAGEPVPQLHWISLVLLTAAGEADRPWLGTWTDTWSLPLTRGKLWKMQTPEGGHPEIRSRGYTHSRDTYTTLEGNRLVFPHCFVSLAHFPWTAGFWTVLLERIPVFVMVVFWIDIIWQPSAWELFMTFWWLECKLHLSIFPLRKHKNY